MSRITTPWRRSLLVKLVVMAGVVLLLQACGGGGKKTPPPPAITASTGYYDNVSTLGGANVFLDSGNMTSLHIADLQAMVHGNTITLVSVANNLAYYATLTSLSGNNYTANVAIYQNNVPYGNTTLSGTLVAGTSITGTFATTGTGLGRGTFSLGYSSANTPVAAISRILRDDFTTPSSWVNSTPDTSLESFQINSAGVLYQTGSALDGLFARCVRSGTVAPISNTALYQVSITMSACTALEFNGTYTGLATSRTMTNLDDRLVVTVTSGTRILYGELN